MDRGQFIHCSCCDKLIEHTPEQNKHFGEEPYPDDEGFGYCFECARSNLKIASYEAVLQVKNEWQYAHFVWPDSDNEPVMVDGTTAQMLTTVHAAMSYELQKRMERMIAESPQKFLAVIDAGWSVIK